MGRAAARAAPKPVPRPPWKRITKSATAPTCSSVTTRQLAGRGDTEQACRDADGQERRRARQADPLEEGSSGKCRQKQGDSEGELREEVGVFGHGWESPTRLPGTPLTRLSAGKPTNRDSRSTRPTEATSLPASRF